MIGDFNNNGVALKTEKLAGSVSACLGFVPYGRFYVPNSNLSVSIKEKVDYYKPILVTFRKNIKDDEYSEITYTKKGLDFSTLTLPTEILSKLSAEVKRAQINNATD